MVMQQGIDEERAPAAGGRALERPMGAEDGVVYYEVVEGVAVAALTRGELERSRGVAATAYEAGRASRNVRPRKQDRYEFIHQLVTAGEKRWDRILQAVLAHNSGWAMKAGRPIKAKSLQNGYIIWLRNRGGS
jgi:hypothetical protein